MAYYCPEKLSARAERLLSAQSEPTISGLSEVELASAIARKARLEEISRADADRVLSRFTAHLADGLFRRVSLERRHFDLAWQWLSERRTTLRTLDALHLAAAAAHQLNIVTADAPMARAARALGIQAKLLRQR